MDENMSFSEALQAIKEGESLQRKGWNGPGQFVFLVPGSVFQVSRPPLLGILPEGATVNYRPHIDLRAADGTIGVWQPSMSDIMANDWRIVK